MFTGAFWLILGILLAVMAAVAWRQGSAGIRAGFVEGGGLFVSVLPNLLVGFALAGFIQVLVPQDLVVRYIGQDSGLRGVLAGTLAGAVTPGGPFTHFPILASFLEKGAGIAPVSAYIASWSLISVFRLAIWEVPLLGWRFVGARIIACLLMPPVIGLLTGVVYRRLSGA